MLVNTNALTPFEFLYNNTLLPPWQKWDHRYRSAVITDGNPTDGWTIVLDDILSTEQGIEVNTVNANRTLTGIHAVYMSCNDLAFGLEDHVVVDLTVSGPGNATVLAATIIGFVEKPKPCLISGFGYYALETDGTPQEWQHINDETGVWVKTPTYANALTSDAFANGSEPTIRSWIGDDVDSDSPVLEFLENGSAIYKSGIKLADIPTDQAYRILGASLSPAGKFLWAIFSYAAASNKVWLGRFPLAVDPANKNDGSSETHTVILSGSLSASSSLNGNIVVDDDALLTASLSSVSTLTASLSVTPGWEMQVYDLGSNAIVGSIGGRFSFNASCTLAISMWDFVHGAKRTPQITPGGGASWDPDVDNYDDVWKEKLTISILAPDAPTVTKAGVSLTNSGRQGFLTEYYIDQTSYEFSVAVIDPIQHDVINGLYIRDYCYPSHATSENQITYNGTYQIDTFFIGDEEAVVNQTNSGTRSDVENCYADADGVRTTFEQSGTTTWDVRIPAIGANLSIFYFTQNTNGYTSVEGNSQTQEWFVIRGIVSIHNSDAVLISYDYIDWDYTQITGCTPGSPNVYTLHSELTTTEKGQLWCGAPIDTAIGDPVTDIEDTSTPSGTPCNSGAGDCGYQCFQDVWSDTDPAPPLQEPESPFGAGQPFSLVTETHFYDITAWHGTTGFNNLLPTQSYEKVQGARSAGRKHMAYWQNTRTPGSVREYKAYLTGGDPFTLDGLTGDVIYRAIHPL